MSQKTQSKPDPAPRDFFCVRIKSLPPFKPIPFPLFVYINGSYVLYLKAGDFLTESRINEFEAKNPRSLFIRKENSQTYKNHIHSCIKQSDLSNKQKAKILRESSMSLVEELFENPDLERVVKDSKDVVKDFVDLMDQDAKTMSHLLSLSSHDFYTYNHSLDVSILSLGLGSLVGYAGAELQELGEGALLHDIGKRNVGVEIITKKDVLTEEEWAIMRSHPQYGLIILNEMDVSDAIKACCFEHHESFSGNGYPQQLVGNEIHPYARIIAVTDTYDALTTKRSYNEPLTPKDAVRFINENIADRYDKDILKAMSSVIDRMGDSLEEEDFLQMQTKKVM